MTFLSSLPKSTALMQQVIDGAPEVILAEENTKGETLDTLTETTQLSAMAFF